MSNTSMPLPQGQPVLQPAAALSSKTAVSSELKALPITPRNPLRHNGLAASPSRLRSASPRLHSPASSEIFERNVQDPVPVSVDQSTTAHIPAHVMTEDQIPPALEASAQAITSDSLNADEVEIVTSSTHQLAGVAVLDSSSQLDFPHFQSPALRQEKSEDSEPSSSLQASSFLPSHVFDDDSASNYGQLDPTDVRRLSFISFADVVQSELQFPPSGTTSADIGTSEGLQFGSLSSSVQQDRTASPMRSPVSSHGPAGLRTPPTPSGRHVNAAGLERSPARSARLGSPGRGQHGELTIETMRQAVRKTASGDLGGGHIRSPALSPILSPDEAVRETSRQPTRDV